MNIKNTLESLKNVFLKPNEVFEQKDKLLLDWIINRNHISFTEIYNMYQQDVFSFAYHILNNSAEAAEVTQEVFMVLVSEPEKFLKTKNLRKYLIGIANNLIKEIFSSKGKEIYIEEVKDEYFYLEYSGDSPFDELAFKNLDSNFWGIVSKLPTTYKMAYTLSYEGFSNQEIAEKLEITLKSAKNAVYRSHVIVRHEIKQLTESGKRNETN